MVSKGRCFVGRVFDIEVSRAVLLELMGYEPGWDRDLDVRMFVRAVDELEWVLDGVVARSEAADRLADAAGVTWRCDDGPECGCRKDLDAALAAYRKEQDQ